MFIEVNGKGHSHNLESKRVLFLHFSDMKRMSVRVRSERNLFGRGQIK